jgi:transcriptional regulator with XRE-family HTH domain
MVVNHLGITMSDFEKEIGVSHYSIRSALKGNKGPSFDVFVRIFTRYPNINLHWLITGTGEMLLGEMASQNRFLQDTEPDYHKKSAADWKAQCEKWEKMAMGLLEKCPGLDSDSSKVG